MHSFSWVSPVNDGVYKSMHCTELPFVFDTTCVVKNHPDKALIELATGKTL